MSQIKTLEQACLDWTAAQKNQGTKLEDVLGNKGRTYLTFSAKKGWGIENPGLASLIKRFFRVLFSSMSFRDLIYTQNADKHYGDLSNLSPTLINRIQICAKKSMFNSVEDRNFAFYKNTPQHEKFLKCREQILQSRMDILMKATTKIDSPSKPMPQAEDKRNVDVSSPRENALISKISTAMTIIEIPKSNEAEKSIEIPMPSLTSATTFIISPKAFQFFENNISGGIDRHFEREIAITAVDLYNKNVEQSQKTIRQEHLQLLNERLEEQQKAMSKKYSVGDSQEVKNAKMYAAIVILKLAPIFCDYKKSTSNYKQTVRDAAVKYKALQLFAMASSLVKAKQINSHIQDLLPALKEALQHYLVALRQIQQVICKEEVNIASKQLSAQHNLEKTKAEIASFTRR